MNVFQVRGKAVVTTASDLDEATASGEWIEGKAVEVRP